MEFTKDELGLIKWALKDIMPWLETDEDFKNLDSVWKKFGFSDDKGEE